MNLHHVHDDLTGLERDLGELNCKASLSSLMSIRFEHAARQDLRENLMVEPPKTHSGSKMLHSKVATASLARAVDVPKVQRYTYNAVEPPLHTPASPFSHSLPSQARDAYACMPHPTSPRSSSRMLSYEEETWRMYHRIQMARQGRNLSLRPQGASLPSQANDTFHELGCESSHGPCRADEEIDQQIIFDLEL